MSYHVTMSSGRIWQSFHFLISAQNITILVWLNLVILSSTKNGAQGARGANGIHGAHGAHGSQGAHGAQCVLCCRFLNSAA